MTEEKIIEKIKTYLDIENDGFSGHLESEIVQGLLDLYNKQKEEIKLIKELNLQDNRTLKMQGEVLEMYKNNFISKDKIREVLEKERKKQKERDDISLALHSQYISLIDKIKKQLLEG